jgi:hypothetical protein
MSSYEVQKVKQAPSMRIVKLHMQYELAYN